MPTYSVDSLLSARQFVSPQRVGNRIYFISDMSGRLSLYVMDATGSVPRPLLPASVALPNPHHLEGAVVYRVLPALDKVLLMLDQDGDENYQPMFLPTEGGAPKPVWGDRFAGQQVTCTECDAEELIALFMVDPRNNPQYQSYRVDLRSLEVEELGGSEYGNAPVSHQPGFGTVLLHDNYTLGDDCLYLWQEGAGERSLLFGKPLEARAEGEVVAPTGIRTPQLVGDGVLTVTSLFVDNYGLGWFTLAEPSQIAPVEVVGIEHEGVGELVELHAAAGEPMRIAYNIDGVAWVYEGTFDAQTRRFTVGRVLVGEGELANGTVESMDYDQQTASYVVSFSSATSPSQLYCIEASGEVRRHTDERPVGIDPVLLSAGEAYPYTSHDGLRISARLYLPAAQLGFEGPRPVIFYIHGGPQSQERPDFTWFSMPLIQYFTLSGFAVWVPNVRGSEGYGMDYMKRVDHDWGGQDRLDHVAAFELLRGDVRLNMERVGVMGRSYGGYMTLTLAGRHPELWQAAVDMFGPYNLLSFTSRLPETWKTYFYQAVGHPEREAEFLRERSPSTYMGDLACPLLVIQGANDPRVVEAESRDVVDDLRAAGKEVEYVVYGDEGHDVIKYANKVDCYGRIVAFFREYLM
jgi:acetyl esterase/lipase